MGPLPRVCCRFLFSAVWKEREGGAVRRGVGVPPSLWGLCGRGSAVRGASLTDQSPLIQFKKTDKEQKSKI